MQETRLRSFRARRQNVRRIQYGVLGAAIILMALFADWNAIRQFFFNASVARKGLPQLFTIALKNTVIYTVTGFAFGVVLGLLLALMRISSVKPYRWAAAVYVEIFRGLPALVIFLMLGSVPLVFPGFALPGDVYGMACLGLGLVSAAYMAENFSRRIAGCPERSNGGGPLARHVEWSKYAIRHRSSGNSNCHSATHQ
jgi:polar amino acid transport system permease protein